MNVTAWILVVGVIVLGWVCAVLPPRPRTRHARGLSERAAAAQLHPTETRSVRRLPRDAR